VYSDSNCDIRFFYKNIFAKHFFIKDIIYEVLQMKSLYKFFQMPAHIMDVLIGETAYLKVKNSKIENGINKQEQRTTQIILSLTTFNKRYDTINLTLKSLLLQTVKPDRIIVWLDEDIPQNKITDSMYELKKYGIEYRHTNLGLKPHNKYFHAVQEFPEDIIITVDDDIIYPSDTIEVLMDTHRAYPTAVCARRVHRITKDPNGKIEKYNNWKYEYRQWNAPSHLLLATGVGGVLYPPHALPPETFCADTIKNYCHNADDIWLKIMEIKNGVKVVWAKNHLVLPKQAKNSQKITLCKKNVIQGENDIYLQKLSEKYPDVFQVLTECRE